jgi:hypothetical protein
MFFAPRKPKTTAFTMIFAGIYAVFTMLQDVASLSEMDKNIVFYDVFASRAQQTIVKKMFKNGLKSISKSIL